MSAVHEVDTYTGLLTVSFRAGYTDFIHDKGEAIDLVQAYCNEVGLCVMASDVTFIYSQRPETPHGRDPGVSLFLINYPRFPSSPGQIRAHAETLGERLKAKLGQHRVTVVYPDTTRMVGEKK